MSAFRGSELGTSVQANQIDVARHVPHTRYITTCYNGGPQLRLQKTCQFSTLKTNPLRTSFLLSGALPASLFSMLFRDLVLGPQLGPCASCRCPYTLPALSLLENETKLGTKKIVKLKLLENELNYFFNQKKPTLTLCFFSTLIWKQSRNVDIKLKTAFQSDANSSSRYQ